MYKSILPLGRHLLTGALLAGLAACDDGGSARTSFNLSPEQLPTNLVTNGSLESSTTELTGWSAYTAEGSTAEAEFTVATEDSFRGDNSFKASIIALGDQPYHIEGGPVNVPVVAGGTYALLAWAKGPAGAKANFTASMAGEPWTTFAQKMVTFTGEWEQVAVTFTLPEDLVVGTIRLPVQMNFPENAGADIYIDDMQLVPTDPPSAARVDVVTNGGLEESEAGTAGSAARGWGAYANPNGSTGTTFEVDATEAYEGSHSFKIAVGSLTAAANPWDIESGAVGVPVVEGQTYTLITWVKGTADARANIIVQLPGSPYHTFASQEVVLTPDWQQVAFDVTITEAAAIDGYEGPTTNVRLYVHSGYQENAGAEIYVDNMQLFTYGEERVVNGSLEESEVGATDIEGWGKNASAGNAPGTSFTVVDSERQEGSNALLVEVGAVSGQANPWDIEVGPVAVPVTEGDTYLFSAWIKGTDGAHVNFNVQMPGSPYHTYANQEVTVSPEWQRVIFKTYIANASTINNFEGPASDVRLYIHMGYPENSSADIYIDNISFQQIEDLDE